MRGRLAASLAIFAVLIVSLVATFAGADPIQVWNGDLDGSTNATKIVTGAKGKPLPTSGSGSLAFDGGAWYFAPIVTPGTAGQALFTNDAGTATVWAYPHGDVDASATDPGALTVNAIQGFGVSTSVPSTGNALVYSSGLWRPSQLTPGWVTLEQYGAVGNGTTDDGAALTAADTAAGSGGFIYLGCAKTYLITTGAPHTIHANIVGCGSSSVLKTTSNSAIVVVGASGLSFQDFACLGNATGTSQDCIDNGGAGAGSGFGYTTVRNVTATSMGGWGFMVQNQDTTNAGVHVGMSFIGVTAKSCGTAAIYDSGGIGVLNAAEYVTVTAPTIEACETGVEIRSGNFTGGGGGEISDSVGNGVYFNAGYANNGHGAITGWTINHSGSQSIYANGGVDYGFLFAGDHIIGSAIYLKNTTGVFFSHAHIDQTAYFFDGSTGTTFDACTWPASLANTVNNSYGGHASTTYAMGANVALDGTPAPIVATGGWASQWRAANATTILSARNAANSADINVVKTDLANQITFGDAVNATALYFLAPTFAFESTDTYADQATFHIRNASHVEVGTITPGTANTPASVAFGASAGGVAITGAFSSTTRTQTAATLTIDTTTTDRIVYVDCTSNGITLTLPTPTNGRMLTVVDKANNCGNVAGGKQLTLARHSTEKLDGSAANVTTSTSGFRFNVYSDGTDWYTQNGTKFQLAPLALFLLSRRRRRAANDVADAFRRAA